MAWATKPGWCCCCRRPDRPACGGVRNRELAEPDAFAADPCPCRMGANPPDRLVATQRDGSIPNFRHEGYPVLGSRPSRRRRVAPAAFRGAKLLQARRNTLGFGCAVRQASEMGQFFACLRGRSRRGCSAHSGKATRIALRWKRRALTESGCRRTAHQVSRSFSQESDMPYRASKPLLGEPAWGENSTIENKPVLPLSA
jgi:hypothetical protein